MEWAYHKEDKRLPKWLLDSFPSVCPECGSDMINGYNTAGECTNRKCSNYKCPNTVAARIVIVCNILGVKGIGMGNAKKIVKENKLSFQFQAIPFIFKDKPKVDLATVFRCACIEGIDSGWENICAGYYSVDDMINNYKGEYLQLIKKNESILKLCETYFDVIKADDKQFKTLVTGNVMITGNIKGFNNRDNFIYAINNAFKGLVELRVVGKRKTDVMALIMEPGTPHQGKATVAVENGIPIYTSDEFLEYIKTLVQERSNKL